ncbi:MAG: glycosyltransferase [Bacteroidetes bacterium]|nr:glycosyltransferase [Bacteroidota bacterium]
MIKVLWFINTPSLAASELGIKVFSGGWLSALDTALQDRVELHVAFHFPKRINVIKKGRTMYYPLTLKNDRIRLLFNNYFGLNIKQNISSLEKKYSDLIKDINPDIIHIHGTENTFGFVFNVTKIPVVLTIQGFVSAVVAKSLLYNNWKYSKDLAVKIRRYKYLSMLEMNTIRNAKYIISKSNWSDLVINSLNMDATLFHQNNILKKEFYLNIWQPKKAHLGEWVITTVLGESVIKGLDIIFKTLMLLKDLSIKIRWQIIGIDSESKLLKYFSYKSKYKEIHRCIELKGKLGVNELINCLMNTDIYVMTSRIENSPNNLSEALLMGIPCISTNVGGVSSYIEEDVTGIMVPDGDQFAIAGAIVKYINNYEWAIKLGATARKKSLERHRVDYLADIQLEIYNDILKAQE